MATDDKDNQERESEPDREEAEKATLEEAPQGLLKVRSEEEIASAAADSKGDGEDAAPAHLGATKYVHAAFFAAGILTAYLSGKLLAAIWNRLAEWPTAVLHVPQLLRYDEAERNTITMIAGAVIGLVAVIQTYRKEHIRRFANEVAIELSKVTWPNKETVTNGTIVVVIASAVAAVYIALLDRLWAFVTALIYRV